MARWPRTLVADLSSGPSLQPPITPAPHDHTSTHIIKNKIKILKRREENEFIWNFKQGLLDSRKWPITVSQIHVRHGSDTVAHTCNSRLKPRQEGCWSWRPELTRRLENSLGCRMRPFLTHHFQKRKMYLAQQLEHSVNVVIEEAGNVPSVVPVPSWPLLPWCPRDRGGQKDSNSSLMSHMGLPDCLIPDNIFRRKSKWGFHTANSEGTMSQGQGSWRLS